MSILVFRVRPNKSKTQITKEHEDFFDIDLAAPPVDDKANEELIAFVAKARNLKKSDVEVIFGRKSKIKKLRIPG